MRIRQSVAILATAAAVALAAPAAFAFKIENKDASGGAYDTNFNIEEQAKNFRKEGSPSSSFGKHSFTTPYGTGTFELSVKQGPSSGFGPGWGFGQDRAGSSSYIMREHFNRVVTPEGLR